MIALKATAILLGILLAGVGLIGGILLFPEEAMIAFFIVAGVGLLYFYWQVIYWHLKDREDGRW